MPMLVSTFVAPCDGLYHLRVAGSAGGLPIIMWLTHQPDLVSCLDGLSSYCIDSRQCDYRNCFMRNTTLYRDHIPQLQLTNGDIFLLHTYKAYHYDHVSPCDLNQRLTAPEIAGYESRLCELVIKGGNFELL